MTPREELIELIEAYAAAAKSDNNLLKTLISTRLGGWLKEVDIVKPVAVPEEIQRQVEEQLPKTPARKTTTRRTRKPKEA